MTQQRLPGAVVPAVWDPPEKEFQAVVIEAARTLGHKVAHFRPAMTKHGWRTPAGADGAGWPDLVIAGRGRILFVELKRRKGRLSVDQKAWRALLEENGGEYRLWTPADWPHVIMRELGATVTA